MSIISEAFRDANGTEKEITAKDWKGIISAVTSLTDVKIEEWERWEEQRDPETDDGYFTRHGKPYLDDILLQLKGEFGTCMGEFTYDRGDDTILFESVVLPGKMINLNLDVSLRMQRDILEQGDLSSYEGLAEEISKSNTEQEASDAQARVQNGARGYTVKDIVGSLSREQKKAIAETKKGQNPSDTRTRELYQAMRDIGLDPLAGSFHSRDGRGLFFRDERKEADYRTRIGTNPSYDLKIIATIKDIERVKETQLTISDNHRNGRTYHNAEDLIKKAAKGEIENGCQGVAFDKCEIKGRIEGVDFTGAVFGKDCILKDVDFHNCNFKKCLFKNQDGQNLDGVMFNRCNFDRAKMQMGETGVVELVDAKGEYPSIKGVSFIKDRKDMDKEDASMDGAKSYAESNLKRQEQVEAEARVCFKTLGIEFIEGLSSLPDAGRFNDVLDIIAAREESDHLMGSTETVLQAANTEIDKSISEEESDIAKINHLGKNLETATVDQHGKKENTTAETKRGTVEDLKEHLKETRELYRSYGKELRKEYLSIVQKRLDGVRESVLSCFDVFKKTQDDKINKIEAEISEIAKKIEQTTLEYAVAMAKKDHKQGRGLFGEKQEFADRNYKQWTEDKISRMQEKIENLLEKEAGEQMKTLHAAVKKEPRHFRQDASSRQLTRSIEEVLEKHPEVLRDNVPFVLNEEVSLAVSSDGKGNITGISLTENENMTRIETKEYGNRQIYDFSPYLSIPQTECVIKALIIDCRLQDADINSLLPDQAGHAAIDPRLPAAFVNGRYYDVYTRAAEAMITRDKEMQDADGKLSAALDDLKSGKETDGKDTGDVTENVEPDDAGDLDDLE